MNDGHDNPTSTLAPHLFRTAANYTVMVTNLPKDMTQYELEKKLK